MPYRDDRESLEARLAVLEEERAALDERIGEIRRLLFLRRSAARQRLVTRWCGRLSLGLGLLLVAAVMGALTLPVYHCPSRADVARGDAQAIRAAVTMYRIERPSAACPTPDRLVDEGYLEERVVTADPWGRPYLVRCTEEDVEVRSAGPDGEHGTDDDVR